MGHAAEALSTPGLVLGAYRPLRPLGSGGSGSVWLAVHEPTGREVALKMVAREGRGGERAEREARAAAQLRHPHIIRAYALGRDPGHVYIAYEYVAGRTLRDTMRGGQLRDGEAIEAAAQVLDALAYAHASGVVHRDVKPSNILMAETGQGVNAKLLDFGLALVADEDTLTAQGDVPGTLAYISPERLRGAKGGPPADVWAIGVLLWEALAGEHPFWKGSLLDTARGIRIGAAPLATMRPDLPRQLLALVDGALALDPSDRPSAAALAAALREAPRRRTADRSRKSERPRERAERPRRPQRPAARRRSGGPGGPGGPSGPGGGDDGDGPTTLLRRPAGTRRRAHGSTGPSAAALRSGAAEAIGGERLIAAALAAVLCGWAAATIPFFPAGGAPAAALVGALLTLLAPGAGLAFALALPLLPLGNIALGAAIAWGAFALGWVVLFRRRPTDGLLLAAAPVLAAVGLLGLAPLVALRVRSWVHRALLGAGIVLVGALGASLAGRGLPFGLGSVESLGIAGTEEPVAVGRALLDVVAARPELVAEAVVIAAAAALLPLVRSRSPLWLGAFAVAFCALSAAPLRGLSILPAAGAAVLTCAVVAGPRVPWRQLRDRALQPRHDPQLHS